MTGHLHLVCSRNVHGASYLSRQSFRAPLHLSKPHLDEDTLVVNMVNPTAGIFDDDEIEVQVSVERGARLVLTTPSASRVYRSRHGGMSQLHQRFQVEEEGFLEFFPEPFIPQAGARCRQRTELHVAPEGSLIYFEWLTPGRVASGEIFRYEELRWETDVWLGSVLTLRERYRLSPADESLTSLQTLYPASHYLSCVAIGLEEPPYGLLETLPDDGVYAGATPLAHGGWAIKLLCRDALKARHALRLLREGLHQCLRRKPASLGRF